MIENYWFIVRHPVVAVRTKLIIFLSQLDVTENPLGNFPVDPESLVNVPVSRAAAMLGLVKERPQKLNSGHIDWGPRGAVLGNRPEHLDQ